MFFLPTDFLNKLNKLHIVVFQPTPYLMGKLLKNISILTPSLLLASILFSVSLSNKRELVLLTQSCKTIDFLGGIQKTSLMPTLKATFTDKVICYAVIDAFLTLYPASQYLTRQYQAYKTWKEASDIYNVGAYPECLEDFEMAYPNLKANGIFLIQFGKGLEMAKKYEKSNTILNEAKQYLNNTILYTCLGNNDNALGKNIEAEQAYLHAWLMAPARLYPLYLLAKLYDETGQQEKAVAMANRVMEKEIKIESTAIREIRDEMKMIINE